MYVALSESRDDVLSVARSHGWSIDGIHIHVAHSSDFQSRREREQTVFHPAEIDLEETIGPIIEEVERMRPALLVIDSLSELRLLAEEPLRYRRQLLALKERFVALGSTVLLVDTATPSENGVLETIVSGTIRMEKVTPVYGTTRRRLAIEKLRAIRFREGYHDYVIATGGVVVHPRLVAADHGVEFAREAVTSGVPALDALLGGGLDRGTSTVIVGAAGTGKSSMATQYAMAAAARGERSVIYMFEETIGTWLTRARALGFEVDQHLASGCIRLVHVDPAELSPGELSSGVRKAVEEDGVRLIVFDSLNGYLNSVPEESYLILHLHELLTYLDQQGVTTLLITAQHGMLGPAMSAPIDVSYLADAVLMLRYFEAAGEVRQAISVVKKRSGKHERTIREFGLDRGGVRVGEPLRDFHGVLTGVPTYVGGQVQLLRRPEPKT